MKYQFHNSRLPKDKREFFNEQVLSCLEKGDDISPDDAFNKYTGIGGLHGLKYYDFENFHDYTEAKKEVELGQFFTPPELCEQIVLSLQPSAKHKIIDFTCGSGNFFNYLPQENNVYGCEIEPNAYKVARFLYPDANIIEGDFVTAQFDTKFDIVIGNPPFNLKTPQGTSQFVFMKKAAEYLMPGRILCFLAPKTFLEDEFANKRKLLDINSSFSFLCQAEIPKHWFDVDIDIKVLYFQRKLETKFSRVYSNTYVAFDPEKIYDDFIEPLMHSVTYNRQIKRMWQQQAAEMARYIRYENGILIRPLQNELMKKYLYHIKAQPDLNKKHYKDAVEKLELLKTQKQPETMKREEWERTQLKPDEIIKWMRKKIIQQYRPAPRKVLKVVKKRYSVKYKAYDKTLKPQEQEQDINDMVQKTKPFVGKLSKLLNKKRAEYLLQNTPWQKMERVPALDEFLRSFELVARSSNGCMNMFEEPKRIKLNDKQFNDLGLAFQKRWFILNWQQGGGKSVAGMAWINFVMPRVRHVFIAAPSLAAQLTWEPRLKEFGYNFILIKGWEDFRKIKKGQIVLLSFDMVRILKKHLKDFIKKVCGYSIALLVDESDELTNISSSRTQAMMSCFRKAKYKSLTTGTTTRNNINELYPQLELLYNNSFNLLCWSPQVYRPDKDEVLQILTNDYHGKPFPAYRGHNLFKYCHCPQRTTVFGIKQDTQDIYNSTELKDLIDKTIITRTFDDIIGKRIYKIKTHHVVQGEAEKKLYGVIIEEFYSIVYTYFNSTGNSRKEALLRIIRQITLLIQSTSIPHTFAHYEGGAEMPQKFYHINDLLREWHNEKVAIGTVMIEAAQEYNKFIQFQFPGRDIFYIDGSKSFQARKKIIAQFQATTNGVLISTQQSLKSSVDIETCNKCILESLQWNIPKMSQYYFRFIRYNSKEEKEIHFVTYAETIEQNVLALLMSKEKLNEFVKTTELHSRAEIMQDFDVDTGILDQIITKEYDHEGKLHLRWGKSKITA